MSVAALRYAVSAGPGQDKTTCECKWLASRWQLADCLTNPGLEKLVGARMACATTNLHDVSLQGTKRRVNEKPGRTSILQFILFYLYYSFAAAAAEFTAACTRGEVFGRFVRHPSVWPKRCFSVGPPGGSQAALRRGPPRHHRNVRCTLFAVWGRGGGTSAAASPRTRSQPEKECLTAVGGASGSRASTPSRASSGAHLCSRARKQKGGGGGRTRFEAPRHGSRVVP